MSAAGSLWAALRKSRERPVTAQSMVQDLFGTSARGGPNTRAAAEALGVSQRTVQRWIKTGKLPTRSEAAERLQNNHQAWQATPEARQAAISPRREARLRNQGTSMVFYGTIAISSDRRRRGMTVDLTGAQMGRILDAAKANDDALAHQELENAFGAAMGGSVSLTIEKLETYR
jgi:transposase